MAKFARNMAFVIGINNYTNGIPELQTAVNDAKKLAEILREQHGYQVWVCLDQIATLKNLNDLFEKTLPQQVTCDDRLLFYFAGHGVALNGDDGPQGYLIPQDAKLGDTKTPWRVCLSGWQLGVGPTPRRSCCWWLTRWKKCSPYVGTTKSGKTF